MSDMIFCIDFENLYIKSSQQLKNIMLKYILKVCHLDGKLKQSEVKKCKI